MVIGKRESRNKCVCVCMCVYAWLFLCCRCFWTPWYACIDYFFYILARIPFCFMPLVLVCLFDWLSVEKYKRSSYEWTSKWMKQRRGSDTHTWISPCPFFFSVFFSSFLPANHVYLLLKCLIRSYYPSTNIGPIRFDTTYMHLRFDNSSCKPYVQYGRLGIHHLPNRIMMKIR